MKKMTSILKSQTAMRLLSIALICGLLMPMNVAWGRGGGGGPAVLVGPKPLNQIPVPVPFDNTELALPQFVELAKYIKDVPSAVALGKALFWDTQVGSDGQVACATCHFKAGADIRLNNTVHPGKDGVFSHISSTVPMGPSYTLNTNFYPAGDFPFFQVEPATGRVGVDTIIDPIFLTAPTATITRSFDDVVGSQGVLKTNFVSIVTGTAVEDGTLVLDPVFNIGGVSSGNLRQVTGRNSPSVINAVFNYANFWDGRANNIFNGVTPIGPLDQSAQIWDNTGGMHQVAVAIPNASLASQAVGPPLSDVEMSYHGRTFPDLGRKMINNGLIPLGQQHVDPNDSVLGGMINGGGAPGLNTTYEQMIQAAFQPNLTTNQPVGTGFTQIEANFSLFWGLSIMLYEATLVSDRAPFDRFALGNVNAMNFAAQRGLSTFGSKCLICHSGSEFTTAVIGSNLPGCIVPDCNPVAFTANTEHRLLTFNQTSILGAMSDSGFFNITVRPTADSKGRGAAQPEGFPFPLSFSQLAQLQADGSLPFATPNLLPGTSSATPLAVDGSFKTSGLRNVELNPPYFHNGSAFTLDQVVEFYTRGGNFPFNAGGPTGNPFDPTPGNPEQALAFQPLGKLRADAGGRAEIVAFLKALTDERVRNEQAPFDHPELRIPNGNDEIILAAKGGGPVSLPIQTFTMNPVVTPTIVSNQTISGRVVDGSNNNVEATVAVSVNGVVSAATVTLTNWTLDILSMQIGTNDISATATNLAGVATAPLTASILLLPSAVITGGPQNVTKSPSATLTVGGFGVDSYRYKLDNGAFSGNISTFTPITLTDLPDGQHTVAVVGRNFLKGIEQPLASPTTKSWFVKATPPALTITPVTVPVQGSLIVSGTVELGIIPEVRVNKSAAIGTVSSISGSWSCEISELKNGPATITVIATDVAFNQTQKTTAINVILRDGAFKGTGVADITDAIKALRFAINLPEPSADDLLRGDVAPLGAPDGKIDVSDALLILKKVVGLINF